MYRGPPYPENFHYKDLFFPDGDSLYTAKFFYDSSSPEGVKTDILRLSRDGKQLSIAATIDEGLNTYRSLAVHNGHVYYPKRQQIMAFPLDRPDAVRILADEPAKSPSRAFQTSIFFIPIPLPYPQTAKSVFGWYACVWTVRAGRNSLLCRKFSGVSRRNRRSAFLHG